METVTMETGAQGVGVATTATEEIDFEARDEEWTDSSTHQLASDWVWISEPEGAQRPSNSTSRLHGFKLPCRSCDFLCATWYSLASLLTAVHRKK